jgi:hypothetical protein
VSRLFPERRTVVIPNRQVRYAIVPWHDALEGEAEEQAYLRHHFAKVHGERAKGWVFRWSQGLASAVDKALLTEVKNVVSIQPAFMASFNRSRKKIPAGGAWLVQAEDDRACVALYDRKFVSVQNARGSWQEILEREMHRTGETREVLHVQ